MRNVRTLSCFLLINGIILSCTKEKTTPMVLSSADTISGITDSVQGKYFVLVTRDSLPGLGPPIVDTLGFDTIEITKTSPNSITIFNYNLSFGSDQALTGSAFYFTYSDTTQFPPSNKIANFFLNIDSIEFSDGYGLFEWESYLFYRGKKIQ